MTKEELMQAVPMMDHSHSTVASEGEPIPVEEAIAKLLAYQDFKARLGISGQTNSVGFKLSKLLEWLSGMQTAGVEEMQVFLALDESEKMTVVLWPYQGRQPAEQQGAALLPYNIGNRQPIV